MELIAEYIDLNAPKIVSIPEVSAQEVDWNAFHESQEHKISMFAGRRTGKTHNIALRASRSEYDCIVFVQNAYQVRMMAELIIGFNHTRDVAIDMYQANIQYNNLRHVCVRTLESHSFDRLRGIGISGKEILFDEVDNDNFSRFIRTFGWTLDRAHHVVFASSISNDQDTIAKRWFKASQAKFFLDSPIVPTVIDSSPDCNGYEVFPSRMRLMIEQLPPVNHTN
ncbi:hypothetical protein ACWA2C_16070 [Priestia megaterium]